MKIKDGYILDTIGGQQMAVALDAADDKFVGMIKLNEVGAFLWKNLQEDIEEEQLVEAVTNQYEVSVEKASADIKKFIATLAEKGILEK